jgi:hypothetical protein
MIFSGVKILAFTPRSRAISVSFSISTEISLAILFTCMKWIRTGMNKDCGQLSFFEHAPGVS